MPSRATKYRRKGLLLSKPVVRDKIYSPTASRKPSLTIKTTAPVTHTIDTNDTDATRISANLMNRRSHPTVADIAVSAMIFKVRRSQNNKDIDFMCQMLNALNIENVPKTMKAIEKKLRPKFNIKEYFRCYYICYKCGTSSTDCIKTCKRCGDSHLFEFYAYSIKQQIQQMLIVSGFYEKLTKEKKNNANVFGHTQYGKIMQDIGSDSFTMIINCDGVCTPNKHLSLWPFVLMINEIPLPERRYIENVLLAGVIPATKKPNNIIFEACLRIVRDDLLKLECGMSFYIGDLQQRKLIKFFTIASCTDKPAEALMQNVVPYNSEYGCPKCFCRGELYHGANGNGKKKKSFTIRVYPFGKYELRCQETCSKLVENIDDAHRLNIKQINKNRSNNDCEQKLKSLNHFGHLGECPLTTLQYMNYGKSFLTDSLHTIYGGAFKKLLNLLLDHKYRNEEWSLFKKIDRIDELLGHIKVPSTTQRRFRSIKLLSKFKASEYRTLFHFGIPVILQFVVKRTHKMLLLCFLTAINLASSEFVTHETNELVQKLLYNFVDQFQRIFGLRHMTSNVHSLLHVSESLKYIGPLWMYSTFNYEGIDKDLISTVHGTTEFAKQLIRQHVLYRDAIIAHFASAYPLSLFTFNEKLLSRKQAMNYHNRADDCALPSPISPMVFDQSDYGIANVAQSYFSDPITLFHSVKYSNILFKTTVVSHGRKFADCCVSFYFCGRQQKFGLIRAIVMSQQNQVRLLIEELMEKRPNSSKLKFKLNNQDIEIPNVFLLNRSSIYHLKHPKWVIKKHSMIFRPGNRVLVLEYPNLKDNS